MAKREAQAHSIPSPAGAVSAIAQAEQALAARVKAFMDASEALRQEIKTFETARAEAEGRSAEPALRLVISRETAEMEAIEEAEQGDEGRLVSMPAAEEPPTPAQIAQFFRIHREPSEAREDVSPSPPASIPEARSRNLARERLYADLGGAAIGLCGAAALINFVLLK